MLITAQFTPEQPVHLNPSYDHAVIIGSGIAGLTAARVLSDFFNQVTIVERDRLETGNDYRQGVPQGRHAHTLMPRGQSILEQLFPSLLAEMATEGAMQINAQRDIAYFQNGRWQIPQRRTTSIASSRPLLEGIIRRRVMALPNVSLITSCRVDGLKTDAARRQVTGLRLRPRRDANFNKNEVTASLVLDTSGRSSKAPQWLASLGYTPPEEWRINPFVAYTSRLYQAPANFSDWKTLYVAPEPPYGTRGGIIVPVEDGRWCATLIGVAGDVPPHDEAGFEAFAQSLPTPSFYQAIRHARPLTPPHGFQLTENRVRRYDKLPRYLEGFLVGGDAAIALNPVYAQGMTAAAQAANALQQSLRAHQRRSPGSLVGLAAEFQQNLSQVNYRLWRIATTQDWDWPITEVTDDSED